MNDVHHRWRRLPEFIFLGVMILYISLRTVNYYWDGISYAYNIEHTDEAMLLHPNHLLYGHLGYAAWRLANVILPDARALDVLQILNAVFASAAIATFYRILRKTVESEYSALCLSLVLAFSATWWKFATDANSYVPSVFFLLLALLLTTQKIRGRGFLIGGAHAIAMLLHELAVFLAPIVVLALWYERQNENRAERIKEALQYLLTAGVTTAITYYVAFAITFKQYGISELLAWVTSFSPDVSFSFNVRRNLILSLSGNIKLFWGGRLPLVRQVWNPFLAFTAIMTAICGILLIVYIYRAFPKVSRPTYNSWFWISCLWIAIYWVFLFFWLPHNTFYRLFYAPAFCLLAGTFLTKSRERQYGLIVAVSFLFFWNLGFDIYPYAQPEANGTLRIAQNLQRVWPAGTVVYWDVYSSDNRTIQYFNSDVEWQPVWNRVSTGDLEATLTAANLNGKTVWFELAPLRRFLESDDEFKSWFAIKASFGQQHEFTNGDHQIGYAQLLPRNPTPQ